MVDSKLKTDTVSSYLIVSYRHCPRTASGFLDGAEIGMVHVLVAYIAVISNTNCSLYFKHLQQFYCNLKPLEASSSQHESM